MARPTDETNERSPLLPKHAPIVAQPGAPEDEVITADTHPDYLPSQFQSNTHSAGDLERSQPQNESLNKPYEGMPAVRAKMHFIFPAIAVGVLLSAADQTIIVSAYGKIGSDLKALNKTSWIATAYFLTLTAFQPLYGKLSDIFGRKSCLLFAYFVFGLGCLFCGVSRTIDELIFSRAFAGLGGSGMTAVVSILLSDIIPLRERGMWQGYINIVFASGAAAGAPIGGLVADYFNWRWVFLAQAPICLIAFVAVLYSLHLPALDHSHWRAKLARIDFLGALILFTAVATLLIGLDRGSNMSWKDVVTIACIATSLPLFLVFIGVETRVTTEPFAPGHIIFHRSLVAAYLCNFFSFAGWLAAIFYIPLHFQAVYGLSATRASLLLIPNIIAGVSGSLFGGVYMRKTGRYFALTCTCYATLVIGMITITAFSGVIVPSLPGMVAGMVICGFSNGIGVTSSLIGLIANVGMEDQAVATACSYLFRSMGSVFGVSVSATAVNQMLRVSLRKDLGDGPEVEKIVEMVRRSLESLKQLQPDVKEAVRRSYATSTRWAFGLEVVLVLGAAVAAWWIEEKRLTH